MSSVKSENGNFFLNIKFLAHLITKSFLLAIFCFLLIICILLICYFGDLFFNVKSGNYKNPLFNAYVIVSPSMVPSIKINDAIIVKRIDNDDYNVGDVITFSSVDTKYEGLTVTHRIVDKENINDKKSIYTTKGDNNLANDPASVLTDSIYGRVILKIPAIGYVQKFLYKPINFFICILIPTVLVLAYDFFRIFNMMSKRKKEV